MTSPEVYKPFGRPDRSKISLLHGFRSFSYSLRTGVVLIKKQEGKNEFIRSS